MWFNLDYTYIENFEYVEYVYNNDRERIIAEVPERIRESKNDPLINFNGDLMVCCMIPNLKVCDGNKLQSENCDKIISVSVNYKYSCNCAVAVPKLC